MAESQTEADALLEKFDAHGSVDRADVPDPIWRVMEHIDSNTGLLGDYNEGVVTLADGGETIQWYPRSRMFSSHDDLLQWLQRSENSDVCFGQVGTRTHPKTDETSGYIEIMESERWGIK